MRDKQDPRYSFLPADKEALLPGLPSWCSGKASACQCRRHGFDPWVPPWEDPLEEEMVTNCSSLAWKIAWTEEPSRLQSMGLQRVWDHKGYGITKSLGSQRVGHD